MVERVYRHSAYVRHRSEHVEYRPEHHVQEVKGYAQRLGAITA